MQLFGRRFGASQMDATQRLPEPTLVFADSRRTYASEDSVTVTSTVTANSVFSEAAQ